MKRFIITMFALAAYVIIVTAMMILAINGWRVMVLYLIFAALCLTPAAIKAHQLLKSDKK